MRTDNRHTHQLRPVKIAPGYLDYLEGSVLIEAGKTRVLCAVSVEERVPRWLDGRGQGWLTAEYAMLPRATHTRTPTMSHHRLKPTADGSPSRLQADLPLV